MFENGKVLQPCGWNERSSWQILTVTFSGKRVKRSKKLEGWEANDSRALFTPQWTNSVAPFYFYSLNKYIMLRKRKPMIKGNQLKVITKRTFLYHIASLVKQSYQSVNVLFEPAPIVGEYWWWEWVHPPCFWLMPPINSEAATAARSHRSNYLTSSWKNFRSKLFVNNNVFQPADGGNENRAKQKCLVLGFPGLSFIYLAQNILNICDHKICWKFGPKIFCIESLDWS